LLIIIIIIIISLETYINIKVFMIVRQCIQQELCNIILNNYIYKKILKLTLA